MSTKLPYLQIPKELDFRYKENPTLNTKDLKYIQGNPPLEAPNLLKDIGSKAISVLPQVVTGIQGIAGAYKEAQGLNDTSPIESNIKNRNTYTTYNDNQSLLNAWTEDSYLNGVTLSQLRDSNAGGNGMASGALSGASSGLAIGSMFGPVGGAIGAGIGGIAGFVSGLFGSKKGEREAQRRRDRYNAEIEKANTYIANNFINNANNIDYLNDNRLASSFYADGGYTPSSALAGYIKSKEAFVPYVYDDRGGAKRRWDPNNRVAKNSVATIGYGFTDKDLINSYLSSGKQMTKEEADKRLEYELSKRIKEVSSLPNFHRLTQHQQDAIMALDYAVGFGNIKKNKALYKALESGNSEELANVFYNYTLGMKDPRIAKGIRKAWDSLGNMAKYGEYKNPYSGQVIDNRGSIPYRNAARGYMDNIINEQLNAKNDERLAEQQRKEKILHPLINWDELPKISGLTDTLLTDYTFAEGGPVNGIENYTEFNAGGTHEENPNNGVQFGVNPETQEPMKAEEGEVKVGDYIFSNRIKPDKSILKVLGLPQKGELSYADIAKALKKKLDKRPNDEIMNKYYNQTIDKLKEAQESTKRLREKAKENIIANASHSLGLVQDPNETQDLGLPNGEELFAEGGRIKDKNYISKYLEDLDKSKRSKYPPENIIQAKNNNTLDRRNVVDIRGLNVFNRKNKFYLHKDEFTNPLSEYSNYKYAKENYLNLKNLSKKEIAKLTKLDPSYREIAINFANKGIEVFIPGKGYVTYNYRDLPNDLTDNEFLHEVGLPTYGEGEGIKDLSRRRGKVVKSYFDTDSVVNGKTKKVYLDSTTFDKAYEYYKNDNRIVGLNMFNEKMSVKVPKNLSREDFAKYINRVDPDKLKQDIETLKRNWDGKIKENNNSIPAYKRDNLEVSERPLYNGKKDDTKHTTLKDYYNKYVKKYIKDSPENTETTENINTTKVPTNIKNPKEGFKDVPKTTKREKPINNSNNSDFWGPVKKLGKEFYRDLKKASHKNLLKEREFQYLSEGSVSKFIKDGGFWADMPFGTKTSIDPKTKKLIHTPDTLGSELKRNYPAVYEGLKRANYKLQYGYTPETHIPLKPGIKPKVVDTKIYKGGTLPEVIVRGRRGSGGRVSNNRSTTSIPQNNTNNITDKPTFEFTPEQVLGIRDASIIPNTPTLNIPKETIGLPEVTGSGVKLSDVLNSKSGATNNSSNKTSISNILGNFDVTNLRYASIVNAGLNVFTDLIGATNYDDFTTANNLENEYRRTFKNVAPELISGSLEYKPFDTDYAINKLQAQGAANRQAIINNSSGNRATATAGLLASDYNLMGNIGNEMIKAQDYNYQQRKQIADFDRQKDIFNAQQINSNYQINNSINSARMSGIERAAAMREQEKDINAQNRNINRNMFIDTMASIGREEQDRRFANVLTQYQIENGRIKYNKDK